MFRMDSKSATTFSGGHKFCTTVDTLTHREPHSMLAAMFSGRHTVHKDSETGYVFVDRDGMHFRHILNWLRDGVAPNLSEVECLELLREAKYYQLLGLVDMTHELLNKKKRDEQMDTDLTRNDIIRYRIKYSSRMGQGRVTLRGVNLAGLDLSNLDLSCFELNNACLKNVNISGAYISNALLSYANLQDASLIKCMGYRGHLSYANLQAADLAGACLEEANLQGANLKGANLNGANLKGANLQRADLRDVRHWEDANLDGANLLGAIR